MKNLDQFISQMMESARLVQNRDVSGASAVIQQALAQAGLATPHAAGTTQAAANAAENAAATATEEETEFVDLNPAPDWSARRTAPPRPSKARRAGADPEFFQRFMRTGAAAHKQAAAAAPAPNWPGRFIAGRHACESGARGYKLYIPAAPVAPGTRRPLVVMLHGCTQNPLDFAIGTKMNELAEQHGCLVLYPEQDASANHNRCWNWFEPAHQARGAGEAEIIAGMTRAIVAEHDAEPSQVFVAGMSAGGAMAAILGAAYPELYAAIGVHSGLPAGSARDMITGLQAMKKPGRGRSLREAVPLIVIHGDADHVVSAANGEAVLQQFVGAHAGLHPAPLTRASSEQNMGGRRCTRATWHDQEGRPMAEHWTVHGAGHTWSGGCASGSHTDATGPCASSAMLRFFLGERS